MDNSLKDAFLASAEDWICNSYCLVVRYIATIVEGQSRILDALFFVTPLPPQDIKQLNVRAGSLLAGHVVFPALNRAQLKRRIQDAANGQINVLGQSLTLGKDSRLDYNSEMLFSDRWFSSLHLQVQGPQLSTIPQAEMIANDNALRTGIPPFDGLADLSGWLNLKDSRNSGRAPSITLTIGPPVDILLDSSKLDANELTINLSAHKDLDLSRVTLAIRAFPGNDLETRLQVGPQISWSKRGRGLIRHGQLYISLPNADSVLAMLVLSHRTIRRQWFLDNNKAVNPRYVAAQNFDRDLKMVRQSVLEPADGKRFEQGVASLLFLLGFSAIIPVETDAPDLIFNTPSGKIAIAECTTRVADFHNKLGKLVSRRGMLSSSLEGSGHPARVDAFLICSLPREQVAAEETALTKHQITLICKNDLVRAFDLVRSSPNPDAWLERAAERMNSAGLNLGA